MGWGRVLSALLAQATPATTGRVVGWGALVALLVGLMWQHPASPFALWRADVALGHGAYHRAVIDYDRVAASHPSASVRAAALRRGALVWAVELDQPTEARIRLERLLRLDLPNSERGRVLARVGDLLLDEGRYVDSAKRLREAHDIDPEALEGADRLARSARAAATGSDYTLAERTWRRLAKLHPVHRGQASVGRAHLRLQRGDPEGALALYEDGVDHAFDPDLAAVARLGVATCLERLGNLDQALAELDNAELPPEALERRADSIRAREQLITPPRRNTTQPRN